MESEMQWLAFSRLKKLPKDFLELPRKNENWSEFLRLTLLHSQDLKPF